MSNAPNDRKHARVRARAAALALLLVPASAAGQQPAPAPPAADYWVYVGAESADRLDRIRFGPDGITIEKAVPVGFWPTEMEGPHGLAISADGRFLHMTTGHGVPDGMYWKFEIGPDTMVGEPIALGHFPATIDVTPDGLYAFAVNFNLHGEHVPSSVSVVYTPDNVEVARIETCVMPHGSRIDPSGTRHYSACMMNDAIVEIDTRTFAVQRMFGVGSDNLGPLDPQHVAHEALHAVSCSPTWAQPSHDGARLYVACNAGDEILEIDVAGWKLLRRFAAGRGPYNLAVAPDGRLLVSTLKQGAGVQVFDLSSGAALATIPTTTKVAHGVVITPDSRYAFVSIEGIGAEPGKVDVIDLESLQRVASVEVGQQAGGIAFWKMEPHR